MIFREAKMTLTINFVER